MSREVSVDFEFSGSGMSPARHNPLRKSSKRRGLRLVFSHLLNPVTTVFRGLNAQPFSGCLVLVLSRLPALPAPAPLPDKGCRDWHLSLAGRAGRCWAPAPPARG